METVIKFLEIFAGFAAPIAVAWFTMRMERERKENAKIKELEREKAEREKKELADRFEKLDKRIDEMENQLSNVLKNVSGLEGVDDRYGNMLKSLTVQHTMSWQYIHELAQLVMVLAAGMRDQHLDGNITKAIARCQEFEHTALSKFMTSAHSNSNEG